MPEGTAPAGARPRFAFYGDDFTGSVDALLQFARGGWAGRLLVGVPSPEVLARLARLGDPRVDVIGIAGIARSLPTAELDAEVRPALTALLASGARVVQYKACSTADSSPTVGSLGRVLEIGREVVGTATVPMLFAQPDFGRYTVFGHHFAAEGGTVHRLDRQPTMSQHPSTPMTESDLARHLAAQTPLPLGALHYPAYAGSPAAANAADALASAIGSAPFAAVVLDAADQAHVDLVGQAVLALTTARAAVAQTSDSAGGEQHFVLPGGGAVFAIGAGGLSYGLARAEPGSAGPLPRATPARGTVLAVSGSRSARTRAQADAAAAAGWTVLPLPLAPSPEFIAEVAATLRAGTSVALTSDDADLAPAVGRPVLVAIAEAATSVVEGAARAGAVGRVIVCGGDTSSRVTRLLGVESLSIAANPEGNIVLCTAHAPDPAIDGLELLLKGGQVGDDALFDRIRLLGA